MQIFEEDTLSDVMKRLSPIQRKFVSATLHTKSKKEAAESIGMSPNSVYKWGGPGSDINKAMALLQEERVEAIQGQVEKLAAKSVGIIDDLLDSDQDIVKMRMVELLMKHTLGTPPNEVSQEINELTEA